MYSPLTVLLDTYRAVFCITYSLLKNDNFKPQSITPPKSRWEAVKGCKIQVRSPSTSMRHSTGASWTWQTGILRDSSVWNHQGPHNHSWTSDLILCYFSPITKGTAISCWNSKCTFNVWARSVVQIRIYVNVSISSK